ncbi:hypothetical protein BKA81DRAFT_221561 [Phyllosticta paracitricarpa]
MCAWECGSEREGKDLGRDLGFAMIQLAAAPPKEDELDHLHLQGIGAELPPLSSHLRRRKISNGSHGKDLIKVVLPVLASVQSIDLESTNISRPEPQRHDVQSLAPLGHAHGAPCSLPCASSPLVSKTEIHAGGLNLTKSRTQRLCPTCMSNSKRGPLRTGKFLVYESQGKERSWAAWTNR